MHIIGKIYPEIYSCITNDIISDEVIITDNQIFKTVLRLATSQDNPQYKNSIITFMKIDDKEWSRLIRNKKILYKKQ